MVMSIVKMKFLNIVGQRSYFDEFVSDYIVTSNMQLESALGLLEGVKGLSPFTEENPYSGIMKKASDIASVMKLSDTDICNSNLLYSVSEIDNRLNELKQQLDSFISKRESLEKQLDEASHACDQLRLIGDIDVELEKLYNFNFMKMRFGKVPLKGYKQLELYVDDLEVIVIPLSRDEEYVWLMYFTPYVYLDKIDCIFSSLYFERLRISGELKGRTRDALIQMEARIKELQSEIKNVNSELDNFIKAQKDEAVLLISSVRNLDKAFNVRKYAAHTEESFYIVGWIPSKDAKAFTRKLDKNNKVSYVVEDAEVVQSSQPPTKLKNNIIFRPFETLLQMYGLPSYNEIDPTPFIAITYFIMFGMMFGDVGQGLVILLGGILLTKKFPNFGGVVLGAGLSTVIFGFMYGSVFGYEDVIPHLWLSPMEDTNTLLISGVVMGVLFITTAIILNIVNAIKDKNLSRVLFDRNGIAGFIFYWTIILCVLYFISTGKIFVSAGFIAVCLLIPLAAIFLKEPLDNLINKKNHFLPKDKGSYFVETFFELLDMIISFASNTISFIRLSAFALNHAGLFSAVFILSEMASGAGSIAAIVIGNILIIGMEGMIVAIQALRLEYYEMFSRFFTGGGRPYKSINGDL